MSKLINKEALRQSLIKVKQYIDDKLFGNSESLKDLISEEISKGLSTIVDSAPETLDTLKEVADWITQDETHSAIIIESINKNTQSINEIKNTKADSALSLESENPVMNKILTARFNGIDTRIDSLPTKLSQFTDDVVAGKYLPLSGGILQKDSADLLVVNRLSSTSSAYITFKGNYSLRGRIGFDANNNPIVQDVNYGSDNHTLLHSGNYATQIADYYLKSTGGTLTGMLTLSKEGSDIFVIDRLNSSSPTTITYRKDGSLLGRMGFNASTNEPVAQVSGIYQNLIHSGNIGEYNAGSATKLKNARTIWGQSFDGTGNVSGNIQGGKANFTIYGYNSTSASNVNILTHDNNKSLWLGYGMNAEGNATIIAGTNIEFRYGTSRGTAAFINSSGNVTIGNSDLEGTSAKLYVNGDAYISTRLAVGNSSTLSPNYTLDVGGNVKIKASTKSGIDTAIIKDSAILELSGSKEDALFIGQQSNSDMWMQAAYQGNAKYPSQNHTYNLLLQPLGGNVGIGTTNPAYKLDVNGDAHISGNLIVDGTITPSTASASYSLRGGTSNKTVVIIEVGSTEETIEHGLGADVAVSLYAKDTTKEDSWVLTSNGDIEITDTSVIVTFDNPTIVEYKVVIVG